MLDVLGAAGLVVSLLLVAWQTRELTRQTRLQTRVTVATAGDAPMAMLASALNHLVVMPHLRPYFYDGMVVGAADPDAAQISQIAELIADAVNFGCERSREMPAAASALIGFGDYGSFLLKQSPVLADLVASHPHWYPELADL